MEFVDYTNWFSERLEKLRIQKNVSARDMSLSLGQSASYINKIENKRNLPSLNGFFYICDYLQITPQEFFNVNNTSPTQATELYRAIQQLTPDQQEHIKLLVEDLLTLQQK